MTEVGARAWVGGALAVLAGLVLAWQAPVPPGADPLSLEDAVDAVCLVVLAAVGLPLLRDPLRRTLGTALCSLAAVLGAALLLDGAGRAAHAAGAEVWGRALLVVGSALLPLLVALVLVLLPVLGPTGQPLWRSAGRAAWAALAGAGLLVLADVLSPGPVDEDAAALGENPLGVRGLAGVLDVVAVAGAVLLLVGVVAGVLSTLARLARGDRDVRRRTAWLVAGVLLVVGALAVDSALQSRWGAVYGVVAAVVALLGLAACTARALWQPGDAPSAVRRTDAGARL